MSGSSSDDEFELTYSTQTNSVDEAVVGKISNNSDHWDHDNGGSAHHLDKKTVHNNLHEDSNHHSSPTHSAAAHQPTTSPHHNNTKADEHNEHHGKMHHETNNSSQEFAPQPTFNEARTVTLSTTSSSTELRSRSSSTTSNSSSSTTSSSVLSSGEQKRSSLRTAENGEITIDMIQQNIKLQKQLIEKSLKEKEKLKKEKEKEELIQGNIDYWHHTIMPHIEKFGCIDKTMYKKWYRNGIPSPLRSKIWPMSVGNELQITPELYAILKDKRNIPTNFEKQSSSIDLIQVDLSRTFPALQFFQYPDGPYYQPFKTILECYSKFRPDIGYVQGMSYIVATLLLYMDEYDAFVCFCNLLHRSKCNSNPLAMSLVGTPAGAAATSATTSSSSASSIVSSLLFGPKKRTAAFTANYHTLYSSNHFIPFFSMNTDYIDKHVKFVRILLREHHMPLYKHMVEELKIEFSVFIIDWFMTLFSKSLPLDVVARIWDGYLVHGRLYLYSCTIGILIYYQQELLHADYERIMYFLTHLSAATNQFQDLDIVSLFSIINVDCRLSDRRINKYIRMMEK
ncbi:hypothetical protein C9374_000925 [Naegleria lovaniensis]|uniref:Rab-GAP TBC domain-containing protein n=1 Tax=Naegleria lovaniensis TaxID=51637 RepID=A0AA88KLP0_NAELO|nr:uncharacterized protein C9374_000925 [Naegleria lovaniensis]KAG2388075.1 hypothetical protein C9374_000925 [Naegleria lovaniensis]